MYLSIYPLIADIKEIYFISSFHKSKLFFQTFLTELILFISDKSGWNWIVIIKR